MASKKSSGSASSPSKGSTAIPKSLRTGSLPRPIGEVWSAGVGALAQARKTGGDSFETLVSLGSTVVETGTGAARTAVAQVETAASTLVQTAKGVADGAVDTVADGVEGVVEGVLGRLGVPGRGEILALRSQVDALQARVAALLASSASARAGDATPADSDAAAPQAVVYQVATHERGWAVQRVGAERATAVHPTKKAALVDARQTARAHAPSRLVVYKADGTVADETAYAAD